MFIYDVIVCFGYVQLYYLRCYYYIQLRVQCCHGFCLFQAAGKIKGDTALHVACYYGKADAVSAIVAGDADPNKENEVCRCQAVKLLPQRC